MVVGVDLDVASVVLKPLVSFDAKLRDRAGVLTSGRQSLSRVLERISSFYLPCKIFAVSIYDRNMLNYRYLSSPSGFFLSLVR